MASKASLEKRLHQLDLETGRAISDMRQRLTASESERRLLLEQNHMIMTRLYDAQGIDFLVATYGLFPSISGLRAPVFFSKTPTGEEAEACRAVAGPQEGALPHWLHACAEQTLPLQLLAMLHKAGSPTVDGKLLKQLGDDIDAALPSAGETLAADARMAALRRLVHCMRALSLPVTLPAEIPGPQVLLFDPLRFIAAPVGGSASAAGVMDNTLGRLPHLAAIIRRSPFLAREAEFRLDDALKTMERIRGLPEYGEIRRVALEWSTRAGFELEGVTLGYDRMRLINRNFDRTHSAAWHSLAGMGRLQEEVVGRTGQLQRAPLAAARRFRRSAEAMVTWGGKRVTALFPAPDSIPGLVEGLETAGVLIADAQRSSERKLVDCVAIAAATAFMFLYVSPFEIGNGRMHRLLLHYHLQRAGLDAFADLPLGLALSELVDEYRGVVEAYMEPIIRFSPHKVERDAAGEYLVVRPARGHATAGLGPHYAFSDLTREGEFMVSVIERALRRAMPRAVLLQLVLADRDNAAVREATRDDLEVLVRWVSRGSVADVQPLTVFIGSYFDVERGTFAAGVLYEYDSETGPRTAGGDEDLLREIERVYKDRVAPLFN